VDKNHGIALVRAALATGGDAGAAADAALRIDEHGLFHNYLRVRQPDRKGINRRTALLNKSLTLMSQSISCEAAARAKPRATLWEPWDATTNNLEPRSGNGSA